MGEHQGSSFKIFEGLKIDSSESSDIKLLTIGSLSFEVETSSLGMLTLKSKDGKPHIMCGDEHLDQIDLIPGIIFSIKDEGFSVQEASDDEPELEESIASLTGLLDKISPQKGSSINLLEKNVSFRFVRGPLLKTTWKIATSPMSFGLKSLLYFFLDPTVQIEEDFLSLSSSDDHDIYLEGHIPGFISVNGAPLKGQKSIANGDFVEFGQTAFYIEVK